jgi:hypothetical protein
VALLAAKPLDLAHRHAFDAEFGEGVFDFFEFERFDDRFDFLHIYFMAIIGTRALSSGDASRKNSEAEQS